MNLLQPLQLGRTTLANRVIMSPMTRAHADGNVPNALMVVYYEQRASAGLIISEPASVSERGYGYANTPGITSEEQVEAWKRVTDAVHARGGHIAFQLWHTGRISHRSLQPNGDAPLAPSPLRAPEALASIVQDDGTIAQAHCDSPREMSQADIDTLIREYENAVSNAYRAGADFVEILATGGYLLHQFLSPGTNKRTDNYGGPIENRARLLLEIINTVARIGGPDRIGVRIAPGTKLNDVEDSEGLSSALFVAKEMAARGIAYLHVAVPDSEKQGNETDQLRAIIKPGLPTKLVLCGDYTPQKAEAAIAEGLADAIAFGKAFIANPDLVERVRVGAPLAQPDFGRLFGSGAEGYTDYPTFATI